MSKSITPVSTDADAPITLANDDDVDEANIEDVVQRIWNHIQYVKDNASGGGVSLTAETFLARASSGTAGAKPATDFSQSLMALASALAWGDAIGVPVAATTITATSTIDLGAADGAMVNITGGTPITRLGVAGVGVCRWVRFISTGQINHEFPFITLPGEANIATRLGDRALFFSYGAGTWACLSYQRADGTPINGAAGVETVASASTVDLGATRGLHVSLTGSVSVSSFGTHPVLGTRRIVVATSGAPTIVHGTNIILPTLANIAMAPGDAMELVQHISGRWRCVNYQRADGTALAGSGSGSSAGVEGKIQLAGAVAGSFASDNLRWLAKTLLAGPETGHYAADLSSAGIGIGGKAPPKPPQIVGAATPATVADVMVLLNQVLDLLESMGAIHSQVRT